MGGSLDDFCDLSMYDYQVKLAAHKRIFGIKDEDTEISTTEDLDRLYAKIKPEHLH